MLGKRGVYCVTLTPPACLPLVSLLSTRNQSLVSKSSITSILVGFIFVFLLQKVSEKVGGAEGTKLDEDFKEMERVSLNIGDSVV